MVYFAQAVDGGPIKIGFSRNVPGRLKQLADYYGRQMMLLAEIEGDLRAEREIHERFACHRIDRTEQFRPDREILEFIGKPHLVDIGSEDVEAMPSQAERSGRVILHLLVHPDVRRALGVISSLRGVTADAVLRDLLGAEMARQGFPLMPGLSAESSCST